ncbi:MAG TPA: ABC transporter ATP-binding protein [Dehalococcoidia bacterium]|nr:ABC transporter ATP-binding protein [Dehalococcoidia bacterium]
MSNEQSLAPISTVLAGTAHVLIDSVGMVYTGTQRSLTALSDINLAVRHGEFVSIIGPSGCGKSTLLRILGGLQTPSSGRVLIDGRAPREAQREKQIGFVFQDPSLMPWRTVIENVRLPLQVNKRRVKGDPERLVDLVGLTDFSRYYPHQLSGGMQQRVALARSFVTTPSLLLMDEPFGALDEITRAAMRYELLRVWRSELAASGCTVVFVTHSIAEAVLLSDRVVVMTPQPGRIAEVIDIDLPRPRPEEIEEEEPFLVYTRRLRSLLRGSSPL